MIDLWIVRMLPEAYYRMCDPQYVGASASTTALAFPRLFSWVASSAQCVWESKGAGRSFVDSWSFASTGQCSSLRWLFLCDMLAVPAVPLLSRVTLPPWLMRRFRWTCPIGYI